MPSYFQFVVDVSFRNKCFFPYCSRPFCSQSFLFLILPKIFSVCLPVWPSAAREEVSLFLLSPMLVPLQRLQRPGRSPCSFLNFFFRHGSLFPDHRSAKIPAVSVCFSSKGSCLGNRNGRGVLSAFSMHQSALLNLSFNGGLRRQASFSLAHSLWGLPEDLCLLGK